MLTVLWLKYAPCDFCFLSGLSHFSDVGQWWETASHAHMHDIEIGSITCSLNQGSSWKKKRAGDDKCFSLEVFCRQFEKHSVYLSEGSDGIELQRPHWVSNPIMGLLCGLFIFPCSLLLVPQLISHNFLNKTPIYKSLGQCLLLVKKENKPG